MASKGDFKEREHDRDRSGRFVKMGKQKASVPAAVPVVELGSEVPAEPVRTAAEPQSESEWLDGQLERNADAATEWVRYHAPMDKAEARSILTEAASAALDTVSGFLSDESLHKELLAAVPPMSSPEEVEHEWWGMLDEKLANPMECEVDGIEVVADGEETGVRIWVNGLATQEGLLGTDSPRRYQLERAHFGERTVCENDSTDRMASHYLMLRFGGLGQLDEVDFVGFAVCGAFLPMKFPPDQFRPPGGSIPLGVYESDLREGR